MVHVSNSRYHNRFTMKKFGELGPEDVTSKYGLKFYSILIGIDKMYSSTC